MCPPKAAIGEPGVTMLGYFRKSRAKNDAPNCPGNLLRGNDL
jgi:hypothetical protein